MSNTNHQKILRQLINKKLVTDENKKQNQRYKKLSEYSEELKDHLLENSFNDYDYIKQNFNTIQITNQLNYVSSEKNFQLENDNLLGPWLDQKESSIQIQMQSKYNQQDLKRNQKSGPIIQDQQQEKRKTQIDNNYKKKMLMKRTQQFTNSQIHKLIQTQHIFDFSSYPDLHEQSWIQEQKQKFKNHKISQNQSPPPLLRKTKLKDFIVQVQFKKQPNNLNNLTMMRNSVQPLQQQSTLRDIFDDLAKKEKLKQIVQSVDDLQVNGVSNSPEKKPRFQFMKPKQSTFIDRHKQNLQKNQDKQNLFSTNFNQNILQSSATFNNFNQELQIDTRKIHNQNEENNQIKFLTQNKKPKAVTEPKENKSYLKILNNTINVSQIQNNEIQNQIDEKIHDLQNSFQFKSYGNRDKNQNQNCKDIQENQKKFNQINLIKSINKEPLETQKQINPSPFKYTTKNIGNVSLFKHNLIMKIRSIQKTPTRTPQQQENHQINQLNELNETNHSNQIQIQNQNQKRSPHSKFFQLQKQNSNISTKFYQD